ncbi:hypothetical protein [Staphylococcus hominis]|uniref:hypothetical protein n=1 Tax=Staphylococcus hominis TaxID=1290 RepID=UPI0015A71575|nr:hypothetical protein [Staphylococcus hominis]
MTQLTLPLETSVLIPTNDMSRHVNDIVETIPKTEFDVDIIFKFIKVFLIFLRIFFLRISTVKREFQFVVIH